MDKISIKKVKEIREELGATHLIIFAIDADKIQHIATHGLTEQNANEAAEGGDRLRAALGWPEKLCKVKPLIRSCKNCTYWEADWGIHCVNGWTGDGKVGFCHVYPNEKSKHADDDKCCMFEPNC
jgi:hypothetical protein